MLRERLNQIFETLKQQDPKLTPYRVAMEEGINFGNLKDALLGNRPFSDSLLQKLSQSPHLGLSYQELMALRVLDEYPPEAIHEAQRFLEANQPTDEELMAELARRFPDPTERRRKILEYLGMEEAP